MRAKQMLSAAVSFTMCLALTACRGSGGSQGDKKDSGDSLTVAIWDNNQLAGLKEIIEDFTGETGIAVEVQVVPWDQYWTLLEAGAQGGELPDVFWMHSNYSQKFMSNAILLDLTDRIAESETIDIANYYEDIAQLYQYDGKTYAIPKDYDTIGLWYNKTMFDEAGISYPDETWTWDTFADAAAKLTKEDGSQYGFTSPASFNQDGYYNLIYSMGGSVLNDDKTQSMWASPETVAAMKGNEYIVENCDVAVLPKAEDGNRISIYNGLGWPASAATSHPEEAWRLLEYLGSEKAQKKQAELGVTMSAYMGTSDTWVGCAPEFNLQAYLDMSENMVIRPYTRNTKVWEDYSQETMVKAYTGDMTMEAVCKDIAAFMDEQIEEEQR